MTKMKLVSIIASSMGLVLWLVTALVSQYNIKTAEKQNDIFAENFTEMLRIVDEITDTYKASGMPKALSFVRENKNRAVKAVNGVRSVCDYFETVTVPGALKDELEKVRATLPEMRRFLDKYENMFHEVMLESEFKAYVREMTESLSAFEENGGFIIAEQDFMRELEWLKDRNRRKKLLWL